MLMAGFLPKAGVRSKELSHKSLREGRAHIWASCREALKSTQICITNGHTAIMSTASGSYPVELTFWAKL
eukprot:584722-Amphidinium_carterae.2